MSLSFSVSAARGRLRRHTTFPISSMLCLQHLLFAQISSLFFICRAASTQVALERLFWGLAKVFLCFLALVINSLEPRAFNPFWIQVRLLASTTCSKFSFPGKRRSPSRFNLDDCRQLGCLLGYLWSSRCACRLFHASHTQILASLR